MADIKLSAILSPAAVQGVQANPVAGNATGTLAALFARLGVGATISGFVLNRDATGNPVLRTTDYGDLLIKTDLFLKIGSDVVVRIENSNPQHASARIVTVDGLPPQEAQARSPLNVQDTVQPQAPARNETATTQAPAQSAAAQATAAPAQPIRPPLIQATVTQLQPTALAQQTAELPSTVPAAVAKLLPSPAAPAAQPTATTAQDRPALATFQALPQLPSGAVVQLRVLGVIPPPALEAPAQSAVTQATPTAAPPASPAATQPLPSAQAPVAASAQTPATTVQAAPVQTPATPAAFPPPLAQPVVVEAEVIHASPTHILVRTPAGTLQVPGFADLPAGSKLSLEINSYAPAAPASENTTGKSTASVALSKVQPASLGELTRSWQTLQQIISALQASPEFTQQDMAALLARMPVAIVPPGITPPGSLPAVPPPLSSGMLFFFTALQGGSFQSWLGDKTLQILEKAGQHNLVKKAEGEFLVLKSLLSPVISQQESWQTYFIPIVAGDQVPMARLYVRQNRKNKDQKAEEQDSRFLVEVEFSQIGQMRMDGWLRKPTQKTLFDLIIRTRTALPEEMQRDIITIYDSAGALAGFNGKLIFQQVSIFPPSPLSAQPDLHPPPDFAV